MYLVNLQDVKLIHRNLLHSYTLTTRDQKEKLGNNPIYHRIKKNKIPRNNLPKEAKDLYSENCMRLVKEIKDDTNRWRDYTIFLDWDNQYCQHDHTTQRNL